MIKTYLKAKHWQLFILMFVLPMVAQFTLIISLMIKTIANPPASPEFMFEYMRSFIYVLTPSILILYGWYWSVGISLQNKMPQALKLNIKRFKVFTIFPAAYFILFMLVSSSMLSHFMTLFTNAMNSMSFNPEPNLLMIGIGVAIIFPLHFFSIFCIIYIQYFISRTLKTIELQREVSFSEYIGEFFLVWFLPIGIWFLQPKVNKYYSEAISDK